MNRLRSGSALWPLMIMVVALLLAACAPVQPEADGGASAGASGETAAPAEGEIKTLFVNSERVECTGVGPMMCLQVRESEDADWQFFYSGIDGFVFVPGFVYELVVNVTPIANPPADGSSLLYTLVEVVSQEPAYQGEAVALVGPTWLLRAFGEEAMVAYDEAATPVTLIFGADGSLAGNAGCNNIIGGFSDDGSNLTIGPVGTTMMMCDEAAMAVESAFTSAFTGEPQAYTIRGDMLQIVYAAGVLTFQAQTGDAAEAPADAPAASETATLVGTEWTLAAVDEAMGVAFDPAVTPVTMLFNEDGSVSGNAGCNNFNGGYTDDGVAITFTPLATTRMLCPDEQMAVENAILQALQGSAQYSIEGNTLTMTTGTGVLVFEGVPAAPAEETAGADEASLPPFGTEWTLVSFDENMGVEFDPAVTTVTVIFNEDGTLNGNSGCNNFFGGFTVDGTLITFEPLGGTRMMCEEPANSVEFAFLNAMQGEALYQISGDTLELITGAGTLTFTGAPAAAEGETGDAAFTGTTWGLVAFDENMGVEFDPAVTSVSITFMDDGSVSGNGGCNNFSGGYSLDGSFITFGALASTMMACPEPASSVEAAVYSALQGEAQYQISGNSMELITGVGTLTFEAQ